jgi:CTP:phosphocholine cytidylyltransferase-like protein
MTEIQFRVLTAIRQDNANQLSASKLGITESELFDPLYFLKKENFLSDDGITAVGYQALEPYKVDNAIIMAAGMSSRCLPLSNIIPKGLFKIKGEILLEREIEQILNAGIKEIILVVGYLKEKFYYLKSKYGVTIIENTEYKTKNNIHSLYLAKEYMKNSYICCSDNYFKHNVFSDYVYDSYYACKYSEAYLDEFCVTKMDGDYIAEITRGGEKCWYTMGEAYFNTKFSSKFVELLTSEYHDPLVHKMLMDDYHIRHTNELKLRKKEYGADEVKEFDTLEEIIDFDRGFKSFINEMLAKGENINGK